jgi:WD40 repeat protein
MASLPISKCKLLWGQPLLSRASESYNVNQVTADPDTYISFFQLNESVCLVSSIKNELPVWSSAIPAKINDAAMSSTFNTICATMDDKILVSEVTSSLSLNYIGVPITSPTTPFKPSRVCFNPLNSNQIMVSGGRDIRLIDVSRSTADVAKCVMTISGAAALAVPTSFTFLSDSPNVVATGWELPSSSYVRLVDLREGSNKSVRIWKSKNIDGLCSSIPDKNLLASFSNKYISIWDTRASKENESMSFTTSDLVKEIHWSRSKRLTIGVLCDKSDMTVRRLDLGKNEKIKITDNDQIGSFEFTTSNDIATLDRANGKVRVILKKRNWIPLVQPRTGMMVSVTETGNCFKNSVGDLPLFESLIELSRRMDSFSLVEAVSGLECAKEISFAFPDEVNQRSLAEPKRDFVTKLLLPSNESEIVLAILRGGVQEAIKICLSEKKEKLVRFLTGVMVGVPLDLDDGVSDEIRSAIVLSSTPYSSDAVKSMANDTNVHVRAVWASVNEASDEEFSAVSKDLTSEAIKTTCSLRNVALVGLKDSDKVRRVINKYIDSGDDRGTKLLNVALLGLLLGAPPLFRKYIDFIRSEVCNRIGGDCWRLRSVIDSILNEESSSGGSARLVCYYCNKLLSGAEMNRCPNRGCHKPLPSCCVCLEPLRLVDWTVWCATCRHGGHMNHLTDWFQSFDECPVAGCNCQCSNIDGL